MWCSAARAEWIPALNNWGGAGRWAFLEVTDPWDAGNLIRESSSPRAVLLDAPVAGHYCTDVIRTSVEGPNECRPRR